ncbi:MAG: hypothetical protein KJ653_09735 [Candidatus Thermoplasmatota archaeon]|nr:hypothetical protein [Candidatus Thermoplasmatota archaeon]
MPKKRDVILMAFSKEDSEAALVATGHRVEQGKILAENGTPLKCHRCDRIMSTENVGRILPGSIAVYCDDPTCFHDFSVKLV